MFCTQPSSRNAHNSAIFFMSMYNGQLLKPQGEASSQHNNQNVSRSRDYPNIIVNINLSLCNHPKRTFDPNKILGYQRKPPQMNRKIVV